MAFANNQPGARGSVLIPLQEVASRNRFTPEWVERKESLSNLKTSTSTKTESAGAFQSWK